MTNPLVAAAMAFAFGYLLGTIPFGLIVTRLAGLGDVRRIGSGNIGATNVLRTGRKDLAALTLLGDGAKGFVAVLVAAQMGEAAAIGAALGVLLGHLFPVWLGFKGGKGVATFLGILFAVAWPAALVFMAVWIAVAAAFRFSSLAALVAATTAPLTLWALALTDAAILFIGLAVLVVFMHRANIARLIAGTESRIGGGSRGPAA